MREEPAYSQGNTRLTAAEFRLTIKLCPCRRRQYVRQLWRGKDARRQTAAPDWPLPYALPRLAALRPGPSSSWHPYGARRLRALPFVRVESRRVFCGTECLHPDSEFNCEVGWILGGSTSLKESYESWGSYTLIVEKEISCINCNLIFKWIKLPSMCYTARRRQEIRKKKWNRACVLLFRRASLTCKQKGVEFAGNVRWQAKTLTKDFSENDDFSVFWGLFPCCKFSALYSHLFAH